MANVLKSLEKRTDVLKAAIREIDGCDERCVDRMLEVLEEDMQKGRRVPPPPPPEGGIGIRAASRLYNVSDSTILDWIYKSKILNVLLKTKNNTYVSKAEIRKLAKYHNKHKGHGKRNTVKKFRDKS